jgi:hypothetical protein
METIFLNFKCNTGTIKKTGHRSSNGWVTSWVDYTTYTLTVSTENSKLPLNCCTIIENFLSNYSDKYEEDQDWGVYISDEDCETILSISELIELLNATQKIFSFQESTAPQPYKIDSLLSFAKKEHQNILQVIKDTRNELNNEIIKLKSKYNLIILENLYPHLRELITNFQIDFSIPFADIDYYPIDLVAINKDYDLLIKSIVLYNPPYKAVNEIYTVLTTGKYSYFDIISRNVTQLSAHENIVLSNYIKKMEQEYGYAYRAKNSYGNEQYFKPQLLGGMTNLVTLYLLQGEFNEYERLMRIPIYSLQKDGYYGFDSMLKFAYLAYARWDKISLDSSSYNYGSDSVFFRERLFTSGIYLEKNIVPFLKRIIENEEVINRLSLFYPYKGVCDKSSKECVKRIICNIISKFE